MPGRPDKAEVGKSLGGLGGDCGAAVLDQEEAKEAGVLPAVQWSGDGVMLCVVWRLYVAYWTSGDVRERSCTKYDDVQQPKYVELIWKARRRHVAAAAAAASRGCDTHLGHPGAPSRRRKAPRAAVALWRTRASGFPVLVITACGKRRGITQQTGVTAGRCSREGHGAQATRERTCRRSGGQVRQRRFL